MEDLYEDLCVTRLLPMTVLMCVCGGKTRKPYSNIMRKSPTDTERQMLIVENNYIWWKLINTEP